MSNLTQKQKKARLAILKDTLKVINIQAINVRQNCVYVRLDGKLVESYNQTIDHQNLAEQWLSDNADAPFHTDVLKNAEATQCTICAKGALFLAKVDRHNRVTVGQMGKYNNDVEICEYLSEEFSFDDLYIIERVFENRGCHDLKLAQACVGQWDKARLVAMLEFLIKNDSVVE